MQKKLNAFHLKCITVALMIAGICLGQMVIYLMAFPLASFLLVEAAKKTSNRKKLLLRLFIAALLVELPMDMATFGLNQWKHWGLNQNYYFTLCVGLLVIMAVEALAKKFAPGTMANTLITLVIYLAAAFVSILCRMEQSSIGVLLVVTMYLFYGNKMFMLVSAAALYILFVRGSSLLAYMPSLSVLLLWWYNGEQGRTGKNIRILIYAAFPVFYFIWGLVQSML